jgi:hypothetical protein
MRYLVNQKPFYTKDFGVVKIKIYRHERSVMKNYLTIEIPNTGENHRFMANSNLYGLCLACAVQGDDLALNNVLSLWFAVNQLIFSTTENKDRFLAVVNEITEGLFKQAEEKAAALTEEDENNAILGLKSDLEYSSLTEAQRAEIREEMGREIEDLVNGLDADSETREIADNSDSKESGETLKVEDKEGENTERPDNAKKVRKPVKKTRATKTKKS